MSARTNVAAIILFPCLLFGQTEEIAVKRNQLWNEFTVKRRANNEALTQVMEYLRKYELQPVLPFFDIPAILALDKAIKLEEEELRYLKELKKEITAPQEIR